MAHRKLSINLQVRLLRRPDEGELLSELACSTSQVQTIPQAANPMTVNDLRGGWTNESLFLRKTGDTAASLDHGETPLVCAFLQQCLTHTARRMTADTRTHPSELLCMLARSSSAESCRQWTISADLSHVLRGHKRLPGLRANIKIKSCILAAFLPTYSNCCIAGGIRNSN